jgi:hypothetical protein
VLEYLASYDVDMHFDAASTNALYGADVAGNICQGVLRRY